MSLNESIVEDAALEWFGELGYAVGHGPQLAPGKPAAERDSFGEVVPVEYPRMDCSIAGDHDTQKRLGTRVVVTGAGGTHRPHEFHHRIKSTLVEFALHQIGRKLRLVVRNRRNNFETARADPSNPHAPHGLCHRVHADLLTFRMQVGGDSG